jgi:hypothetical protein
MNSIQRIYPNRTKPPTRQLAIFTSKYVVALPNLTVGRTYPIFHVKKQSNDSARGRYCTYNDKEIGMFMSMYLTDTRTNSLQN